MCPQHQARGLLRPEATHDPVPQHPRRAQLRNLHEEIHPDGEEERQPPCEVIDIHSPRDGGLHVFFAVRQREGQLLHQVRTGLLHVVARDRDRVELRHLGGSELDDVGNDPHRRFGRVDVGVPHHELFQDTALYRPRKILATDPCSSPATMKLARIGITAPFIVMETLIFSSGMLSKSTFMSSTESIATPAFPTSPTTRGWSPSYPRCVARSKATETPCCPPSKALR